MIFTIANLLSFMRGLSAFVFFSDNIIYRVLALLFAAVSDGLDGYFARRFKTISKFSANLDAAVDKFFVCFILAVFFYEGRVQPYEIAAFLARDISYFIFIPYLMWSGLISCFRFQSVWYSKLFTTLQFGILMALTVGMAIPPFVYFVLVGLSFLILKQLSLAT